MLERKQPEPHRRGDRRDDRGNPRRGEARGEQRGLAIEGRPRPPEHEQQQAEDDGLFIGRTLEE